jgi:hypothetical protein
MGGIGPGVEVKSIEEGRAGVRILDLVKSGRNRSEKGGKSEGANAQKE